MMRYASATILILLLLLSCSKGDDNEEQPDKDSFIGKYADEPYLAQWNPACTLGAMMHYYP